MLPVYRSHLCFWNNTAVFRATQAQAWRMCVFDLSLVNTTVDAWNNIFVCEGGTTPTELSWVQVAGTLHLRGTNLAYGPIIPAAYGADATMYAIDTPGTLLTSDPLLSDIANQDYRLGTGSPAIDQATGIPTGVPAALGSTYPLLGEPRIGTNGWVTRNQEGDAMDLGAIEYQP